MRKWIRPVTVLPALALTVHYPSASALLYHMAMGACGGILIEWLAIALAADIRRKRER